MDEVFYAVYAVSVWASSPRDCGGDPSATRRDDQPPREAKPFYADSSCASAANPSSSFRRIADPMTFLRAIPYPAVSPRRSFSAKMEALTKGDALCAVRPSVR